MFAETEKPAIYYAKPPGLNDLKNRSSRIEYDQNDSTGFENDGGFDGYDEPQYYEEPKQSKKGKTNKSQPVQGIHISYSYLFFGFL